MTSPVTSSRRTNTPTTWVHLALLAVIVVLAGVLRFIHLGSVEAHFDEIWHLELSTGRGSAHMRVPASGALQPAVADFTSLRDAPPWYAIPTSLRDDTHPVLHYLLLRFW